MQRRLTAIMAADVVGYSRLMERDETGTLDRLQANRRNVVLPQIAAHGGRVVKLMGDGSLVEFSSIVAAVACAIEIQGAMDQQEAQHSSDERICYRIGLNLGDVMVDGDDLYGDGVNIAARLQELASPGGIALSASVKDHIAGKIPLELDDQGEQRLKNIERPVRVFSIRRNGIAATAVPLPILPVGHAAENRRSLCVLPFTNMSGEVEQEFFSDGITEDIITDLSKLSGLAVVPRNTAFSFKGKATRLEQIARDVRADYVLEGSVRKAGNRIRISAQLTNIAKNFHLWAERFDRTLEDVFAIQDEISKSIVDALKIELLPNEEKAIGAKPTANPEAYEIYLIARSMVHEGQMVRTLKTARRLFEKAYTLDPSYARAYAAHASCDCYLQFLSDSSSAPEGILANAKRALELEPGLADAHAALGFAYHTLGRKRDAQIEFENALSLDSGSFDAHYLYARHSFTWGEIEKAITHYEKATALAPDDFRPPSQAGAAYEVLGRKDLARPCWTEGMRRLEKVITQRPDHADALAFGAVLLVSLGEKERATAWAARAALLNEGEMLVSYNLACFYSLIGEPEVALDCLEQMSSGTPHVMAEWMSHDPDMDPLRALPRFQTLVARWKSGSKYTGPGPS
jgi:adenylate cyclase